MGKEKKKNQRGGGSLTSAKPIKKKKGKRKRLARSFASVEEPRGMGSPDTHAKEVDGLVQVVKHGDCLNDHVIDTMHVEFHLFQ